jgi:hypothetical protein
MGVVLLILGVFVQGRPDTWVQAGIGAGIMIISAVVLLVTGGVLRWGGEYFSK